MTMIECQARGNGRARYEALEGVGRKALEGVGGKALGGCPGAIFNDPTLDHGTHASHCRPIGRDRAWRWPTSKDVDVHPHSKSIPRVTPLGHFHHSLVAGGGISIVALEN